MAELKRVKLMRGNEASRLSVIPAQGEQISTIDELKLYLGDGNKAGGFMVSADNTIAVWPDQTDATKKLSLAWWIAYFNGSEATVRIPKGTHEVLSDMTIPENICLKFDKGASLKVADTKTLTINGAIEAGLWQIFDGFGTITGTANVSEIYVEWFGADYTDDTDAFIKAAAFSISSDVPLALQNKTYNLFEASLTEAFKTANSYSITYKIPVGSILGKSKTVVNLTGLLGFNTSNVRSIQIENIKFVIKEHIYTEDGPSNGGYGAVFTAADTPTVLKDNIVYRNLEFIAEVTNPDDFATLEAGPGAIREYCNKGIFENIMVTDMATGITVNTDNLGGNYTISNCNFYNIDTALWTGGSNYTVSDIKAINNYYRQFIWVNKNTGTENNGKDLCLCTGINYTLQNLYAEALAERCVYSQGSNVVADNLTAVNTGGFKFVGREDSMAKNVRVNNVKMIIETDIYSKVQLNGYSFSQLYWVDDIQFSNCQLINNNVNLAVGLSGTGAIFLCSAGRGVKNLTVKDSVFMGFNICGVVDTVLSSLVGGAASDYLGVENVKIERCRVIGTREDIFAFYTSYKDQASTDALNYPAAKNVQVINCEYECLTDSLEELPAIIYDFSYTNGFKAVGNRIKQGRNSSSNNRFGISSNNFTQASNIYLDESWNTATAANPTAVKVVLDALSAKLVNGSKLQLNGITRLTYEKQYLDGKQRYDVEASLDGGYQQIVLPWTDYTWELFTKEAIATGKVTGGVITVLTGALPNGSYISVGTGTLVIRGDIFSTTGTIKIHPPVVE